MCDGWHVRGVPCVRGGMCQGWYVSGVPCVRCQVLGVACVRGS